MPLAVRLDATLQAALDRHCAEHGVSKSFAVQESLAVYLLNKPAEGRAKPKAAVSANFEAFFNAGLVGGIAVGQGADKATVRARLAASLARRRK